MEEIEFTTYMAEGRMRQRISLKVYSTEPEDLQFAAAPSQKLPRRVWTTLFALASFFWTDSSLCFPYSALQRK